MSNKLYPKYKKAAASGGSNVNLLTGVVKIVMVDTGAYTYDDAHEFLSDIPSGARISISGALTSKSVTDLAAFQSANGRCDAVTGTSVEGLVGFVDTGSPSTSRLVWFEDDTITGLPVTPAGASYNIIMPSGGWCIF
jgi:hypothetical protein